MQTREPWPMPRSARCWASRAERSSYSFQVSVRSRCAIAGLSAITSATISRSVARFSLGDAISALSCQAEQPGGVLLQDERPYVGPNVDRLEVRQPAVRRDHGVVRTEQY